MKGNKSLCPVLDVDVGDNKIVVKSIVDQVTAPAMTHSR